MVPQDLHYTKFDIQHFSSSGLPGDAYQSYHVSIQPPNSAAAPTTIAGMSKHVHCLSALAPDISLASNPI